jgi:hypothetical protein
MSVSGVVSKHVGTNCYAEVQLAHKTDDLTAVSCLEKVGTSTFHNFMGLHGMSAAHILLLSTFFAIHLFLSNKIISYYYFLISFFIFICGAVADPSPLLQQPFIGLLYQPWIIDGDDCGAISVMNEWHGS